jgi:hypothetical protein
VEIVPSKDLVVVRLGHLADLSGWEQLGASRRQPTERSRRRLRDGR